MWNVGWAKQMAFWDLGWAVRGDERANIDLWDLSDLKDIRVFKVG